MITFDIYSLLLLIMWIFVIRNTIDKELEGLIVFFIGIILTIVWIILFPVLGYHITITK